MYSIETKKLVCEAYERAERANGKFTVCILSIELTRRCNLTCNHCMKGQAENLDIPDKYIDSIMDQVGLIYCLSLSGGEITLCPERIRYVLDSAKRHNVRIKRVILVTNGVIKSEDLLEAYADFLKYVEMPELSYIQISNDVFHMHSQKLRDSEEIEAAQEEMRSFYESDGKNKVEFQDVQRLNSLYRLGNCAKPPKAPIGKEYTQEKFSEYVDKLQTYYLARSKPFVKASIRHTGNHICKMILNTRGFILTSDLCTYHDSDDPKYYNGHVDDTLKKILRDEIKDPYCRAVGGFVNGLEDLNDVVSQIQQALNYSPLFGYAFSGFGFNRTKAERLRRYISSAKEIIEELNGLLPEVETFKDQTSSEDGQKEIDRVIKQFKTMDISAFQTALDSLDQFDL